MIYFHTQFSRGFRKSSAAARCRAPQMPILLDELAGAAPKSRFYFCASSATALDKAPVGILSAARSNVPNKYFNTPPGAWVKLLAQRDLPIKNHLTTIFRGRTGVTPAKYRSLRH